MNTKDILQKINWPNGGKYILAVSGGVDSVVLLDIFAKVAKEKNYELTVAHFDHAMRPDSPDDIVLVRALAANYSLEFVNKTADKHLKSEGDAREARYQFLRQILASHMAKAIITAHHRDDYEETIVFNALRGTNIRGLVPFRADQQIIRPLVGSTKQELTTYARHNKLIWHEDNSNTLHKYMRNVLRSGLLPFIRSDLAMYESFQQYAKGLVALQLQTDGYLATWLLEHVIFSPIDASIDRTELAKVAFGVSQLLIYEVLRQLKPGELSQVVVREAARQARIARPATVIPLGNGLQLRVKTAIVIIMII